MEVSHSILRKKCQGKEVLMALSQRERTDLQQEIRRIEKEIRDKEAILDSYKQKPSMRRYIPELTHQITGLKHSLQSYNDALKRD